MRKYLLFLLTGIVLLHAGEADEERLRILNAVPRGSIESLSQANMILVVFSEPMVPLSAITGEVSFPLEIEPPIEGKLRWLGTMMLAFEPADSLPYATEFRVRVPAGVRSVRGHELREDYVWTFSTPAPKLIFSIPSDQESLVDIKRPIFLFFNQPMDSATAGRYIKLLESGRRSVKYTLRYLSPDPRGEDWEWIRDFSRGYMYWWDLSRRHLPRFINDYRKFTREEIQENLRKRVFVLYPEKPLKRSTYYKVKVKKGIKGAEGDLPGAGAAFYFRTYNRFEFRGIERVETRDQSGKLISEGERQSPDRPIRFVFSNPVNSALLALSLTFDPPVEIPDYYRTADRNRGSTRPSLDLKLLPDTLYRVTIPETLVDVYGNRLGKRAIFTFRTGDFRPDLLFKIGHGIVESYEPHRYPVELINFDSFRLQMARIYPDEVIPLFLSAEEAFNWIGSFFRNDFSPPGVTFLVDTVISPSLPRNRRYRYPLNLDLALQGDSAGIVLLQLPYRDDQWNERYRKALLQVTGLGASLKYSPADMVVYVNDLRTGRPLSGALVEVRDKSNRTLWSGESDGEGLVRAPGWAKLGINRPNSWRPPEFWVFIKKGGDFSFLSSEWDWGIEPYRFHLRYDWNPTLDKFYSVIFTDRKLYRLGDTVHVEGIFRVMVGTSSWKVPAELPCRVTILGPLRDTLEVFSLALDDWGSFDRDVVIPSRSRLGTYWIFVDTLKADGRKWVSIGRGHFRVEEFRAATFEVNVRTDRDEYIFGDSVICRFSGRYLFGAPMKGASVRWNATLGSFTYRHPIFADYSFGPMVSKSLGSFLLESGGGELDEKGEFVRALFPKGKGFLGSARLTVEATVRDPSARSVSGRKTVVIHRGEFYIGLKGSSRLVTIDSTYGLNVVTVRPDGSLFPGQRVQLKLFHRQWISVRKVGLGGRYEWVTEEVDSLVDSAIVITRSEPLSVHFTPRQPGFYFVKATSEDERANPILSEECFYVSGEGYAAWERRDDDFIELVPDRASYRPGDVARILVKSPFESATALITVEREGIIRSFVEELEGTAPSIEVPISGNYIPNVYVSVILKTGRAKEPPAEGPDLGKPRFKIGYAKLRVDPGEKHLEVDIKPRKEVYRPGDEVRLKIKVNGADGRGRKARVTLAVVDAGVLNLLEYKLPDPFDTFYGERPLSVRTAESLMHLVEQRSYGEKGEERGGGGGRGLRYVSLRKDFRATAFWKSSIMTDKRGRAEVKFRLPENLTTWRIMAVAQTKTEFGRGVKDIKTTKPLTLLASVPRFLRVGDSLEAGIVATNNSALPGTLIVEAEGRGIELTGEVRKSCYIAPGASREVLFDFRTDRAGEALFRFRALLKLKDGKRETDGVEVSVPVEIPGEKEVVALMGATEGVAEEKVIIPRKVFPDTGGLQFLISSTALTGLTGSVEYLLEYEYQCLEQVTSEALALLLAEDLIRKFHLLSINPRAVLERLLEQIKDYRIERGPFSGAYKLWKDDAGPNLYATAYVAYLLVEAEKRGVNIDRKQLEETLFTLENILEMKEDVLDRMCHGVYGALTTKAFVYYVLTLAGKKVPGYAEVLFRSRDELPLFARAFLLKAYHLTGKYPEFERELLRELENAAKVDATRAHFEEPDYPGSWWFWSSSVKTTAILLQTFLEVKGDYPLAGHVVQWLVDRRKNGHWNNTQENFYVLHALMTYFDIYEREEPDFKAFVRFDGDTLIRGEFHGRETEAKEKKYPLGFFPPGDTLDLSFLREGTGKLYYTLRMEYYPLDFPEPVDAGITLLKEVRGLDGKPVENTFERGKVYRVTLRLIIPMDRYFLILEDPLPAGLEAVNLELKTESQRLWEAVTKRSRRALRLWGHKELHDNRVVVFSEWLRPGVYEFSYLVRALTPGEFVLPPARVEEMYTPEVFGRTEGRVIQVR